MMWVCRAGKDSIFFDEFIKSKTIALPWEGYRENLSNVKTREDFKQIVITETGSDNRTSISNWSGQLFSFCVEMELGDYVLIPARNSKYYVLGRVSGESKYDKSQSKKLHHIRAIEIICDHIDRSEFSREIQYSLGAYRTIFKCKYEDAVLSKVNQVRR